MMTAKKIGKPLAFETAEKLSEAIDNYFESDAYIPDKEGNQNTCLQCRALHYQSV